MKAIIVDSADERVDPLHNELLEWVASLGVDTKTALPRFILVQHEDGPHAHFAVKRQRDGHDYITEDGQIAADYDGADVPLSGPWPAWFGDPLTVPDIAPADILHVLTAANQARTNVAVGIWHHRRDAGEIKDEKVRLTADVGPYAEAIRRAGGQQ